jgi:hypothetical protein
MKDRTIQNKSGRDIGIHDKPGAWKISAYQRDVVYQKYKRERVANSPHCTEWIRREAKALGISPSRLTDFLREGDLPNDRWNWWVGCSL